MHGGQAWPIHPAYGQNCHAPPDRLKKINPTIYAQVKQVLDLNKSERHIRGGIATREKYARIKSYGWGFVFRLDVKQAFMPCRVEKSASPEYGKADLFIMG